MTAGTPRTDLPWKLAPVAVTKPWGLVHREALELTGIKAGIGELWIASAQTGPGNYSNAIVQPPVGLTLADALERAASQGDGIEAVLGRRAAEQCRSAAPKGKTEAWYVRAAFGRTGIAAGPRTTEQVQRLRALLAGPGLRPEVETWPEEVRDLFGIVEPLEAGQAFLVPAGALHTMFAVGPEGRLIIDEVQQGYGDALLPTLSKVLMVQGDLLSVQVHPDDLTVQEAAAGRLRTAQDLRANPTVRVYDFGRRPGVDLELGFALVRPQSVVRRLRPVRVRPAEGCTLEALVIEEHFVRLRHTLEAAVTGSLPEFGTYHVLHCLEGGVQLGCPAGKMSLRRGETAHVPAALEADLRLHAPQGCALFDDCFASPNAVKQLLVGHGAPREALDALLAPPPAVG